jgi:hypothetical protein
LFDGGDFTDPMVRSRVQRELRELPAEVIDRLLADKGQPVS